MKKFYILFFLSILSIRFISAQITISQQWVQFYNGPDSLNDGSFSIDYQGNVYVTGASQVPPFTPQVYKITTIKYSPSGTMLWVATYDSISNASFKAIAMKVDASGNVYVSGSVINNLLNGTTDIVTLKYGSNGNLLWASLYANPLGKQDEPRAIAIDNSGNAYVTGFCSDSATAASSANKDIYTIKYNSTGMQQWAVQYNDSLNLDDVANDIAIDNSGNAYVTGFSNVNSTNRDIITVKYNASGIQQWVTKYNGGDDDYSNKLALDNANNIIVAGSSVSTGAEDFITIKYNNAGVQQWVSIHDGAANGSDIAHDIAVDNSNNIIVTGEGDGIGTDDDFITLKYNSSGTQLWVNTFNGTASGHDAASALSLDTLGNIYITGSSFNTGTDADYTTIKYSPTGIQQWAISFDGVANGPDAATDIKAFANGEIYVTGYSYNGTDYDFATVKYTETTSIPLTISTTINDATCNGAENGTVGAVASGGTPPYSYQWSNGQTTQNITGLAAGTYSLIVTDSIGATATKIVAINEPFIDTFVNPASCSELFFSEYVEGSTHNTALEIYNPTDSIIFLNRYFLRVFMNGAPTPLISQLVGFLAPKQTHVIANPNASAGILTVANQTSNKINFNGDDPIQLIKVKNEFIPNVDSIEGLGQNPHALFDTLQLDTLDQIGIPGVDPGNNGYPVGSGSTKDVTLRRNFGVTSGTEDWNCGQAQWKTSAQNDVSGLGLHLNNCSAFISNDIDSSNIVFINDTPVYVKNQVIVRFDSSVVDGDKVNDGLMKYGNLPVFINSNALSAIGNKLGNPTLPSQITVKKIFENLKTTDTLSISRLEDTVSIPPFWATFLLSFPEPTDIIAVCDSLNDLFPMITYAEPNHVSTLNSVPNDALYSNQESLHYTSSYPNAHINAEAAWNYEVGKGFIKVGVFDTGIQYAHEDFGNGTFQGSKIAGGYDYLGSVPIQNSSYPDPVGHGTSVAGVIGALRNNNKGIVGIAGGDVNSGNTGVRLYAMKISGSNFAADNVIAQAIVEGATSTNYGLHIMNNSWGGPNASTTIKDAVRFAFNNSVIFVASRGNDGNNSANYPACYRENWVINVGASGTDGSYKSTTNGDNWWASSYGLDVDFIAPGTTEIVTATENTSDYVPFNGTSSAAPHVSGTAALMLSHYNLPYSSSLNLAPEDVEIILQRTAIDKGTWGYDDYNGWGLINAANAVNYVDKPFFELKHIKISISAASLFQSNVIRTLSENFNGLAAGNYYVNIYQYTYTYNFSNDLAPNKVLWGDWARNSSSNLWANSNPIVPETNIFEQSYTNNTVIVRGYIYKIISNILGQQINQWVPFDPASINGQLAFTLHIYDPNAVSIAEINLNSDNSLYIFPNPTNNSANVIFSISKPENVEIELRNISGSIIKTFVLGKIELGSHSLALSLDEFSPGVYFIKLKSIENSICKKLVIVR